MTSRWRLGPIAASVFAGFMSAAVVDTLVTVWRAAGPAAAAAPGVLELALGLYGTGGLAVALVVAWLAGGVLGAVPGGTVALLRDERQDAEIASGIMAVVVGVALMAAAVAWGHKVLVRPMQSDKLATIAVAGLVLLAAPVAAALALTLLGPISRWVTPRLPRPRRGGRTGLLLAAGALLGGCEPPARRCASSVRC